MKFQEADIPGVFLVEPEPSFDERGFFARVYCKREFERIGFHGEWVQMNHSYNRFAGIFRGFHYQLPPMQEAKLVSCVAGAVLDYVVDLRRSSPTFLRHFSTELSAANRRLIFIPPGVAHGFLSRIDHTTLVYQHSQFYDRGLERGLRHDDPRLGFSLPEAARILSDRDRTHALLPPDFEGIAL